MTVRRKLAGAQAALFAHLGHEYIDDAGMDCHDTPEEVPLFSNLSKAQRLRLVGEVLVGVICEEEPLPPDTIQHNATFRALIHYLFVKLEVEIDTQGELSDVGEDLFVHDNDGFTGRARTDEEMEEYRVERALIEHRAEKNMKKLERKDVGEFRVNSSNEYGRAEVTRGLDTMTKLFAGGPVSAEQRSSIVRPLNSDERCSFRWRILCDAALQEDDYPGPFSLASVNFDWRCQVPSKWYSALNLLLDTKLMDYGSPTNHALICGEINHKSYADPSQLPRIQAIESHVDILRKVFQPTWDPKLLALDQRLLFALGSTEIYAGYYHKEWLFGFLKECKKMGVDITKGGSYQLRLDAFRKVKDSFVEGCEYPFEELYECNAPLERIQQGYAPKNQRPPEFFEKVMCSGPGKPESGWSMCFETENLMTCSVCKTVYYCSAYCQKKHWPEHKKHCKRLAKERKDKEKIIQMARK